MLIRNQIKQKLLTNKMQKNMTMPHTLQGSFASNWGVSSNLVVLIFYVMVRESDIYGNWFKGEVCEADQLVVDGPSLVPVEDATNTRHQAYVVTCVDTAD